MNASTFTYYLPGYVSTSREEEAVGRMSDRGARRFAIREDGAWKSCTEARFDSVMTMPPEHKIHFKDDELFTTFCDRPESTLATVKESAWKIVADLPAEMREYARSERHGEHAGFAALHDKCDANMLLPFADDDDFQFRWNPAGNDAVISFWNAVMAEVTRLLLLPRDECFVGRNGTGDPRLVRVFATPGERFQWWIMRPTGCVTYRSTSNPAPARGFYDLPAQAMKAAKRCLSTLAQ
jgi:hypothetical protein